MPLECGYKQRHGRQFCVTDCPAGEPGGIFKECIPVVVHGKFASAAGVFEGDLVEVKHSDEYVAVNDDRLAEADDLAAACQATGS